jgi:3-isopropylmalate/(R)-2-methylmalate dehydratase small subunit
MSATSVIQTVSATAVAIRGNEIDTDRIIPARYLRCVTFDGLGEFAFWDERFAPSGAPQKHPLNDPRFSGAGILVVNSNFGCGSSREHAPQALSRWGARWGTKAGAQGGTPGSGGIKAIIAESFADIFAGNCAAIGVVAVTAAAADVARLQAAIEADPKAVITLDLQAMTASMGDLCIPVAMPASHRQKFLAGTWDTVAALMANKALIAQTVARVPYAGSFGTRTGT